MMDEKKDIKPETEVEITDSGPIRIKGNFILKDLKRDAEWDPEEILLCRCGKSTNKPFCDDSHKTK